MLQSRRGEVKLFNVNIPIVVLVLLSLQSAPAWSKDAWSCAENAKAIPLNLALITGIWYEVARIPRSEVPACTEVYAPALPSPENTYRLRVRYFNNVNNQWKMQTENLDFKWNNNRTENGIFDLRYSDDKYILDVIFKVIYTDYQTITIVCGYSNIATHFSLIKALTRTPQPSTVTVNEIKNTAKKYNLLEHLTWVDQSDRCNGAAGTPPVLRFCSLQFILLALVYF